MSEPDRLDEAIAALADLAGCGCCGYDHTAKEFAGIDENSWPEKEDLIRAVLEALMTKGDDDG